MRMIFNHEDGQQVTQRGIIAAAQNRRKVEKQLEEKQLPEEETKIVDIQFGFDNAAMLRFLEQRATALKNADFEKADKIEKEMTEYKNQPDNFK